MDKEIALENKIKELDNIVYKVALGYQNPFYLKKAQRIKPTLYGGIVISKKHDVISVVDEEETLILEEDSRSKMLAKQNDPISKENKFNISPINYSELNKMSEDFEKKFVSQMQLFVEQAFWLPLSNPKPEQLVITQTPVEIKVPKELPKISLVFKEEVIPFINSLRASFKDFENGLHSELNEVKMVFNQMEAADVMNIVMHGDSVSINVLPANNKCLMDDNLESERLIQENDHLFELLLSQDIVYICVNSLATLTNYAKMEKDYINEYSENLMLKAELAKKEHMVEKKFFDEVVLRCLRLENQFFKINERQAKLEAKDVSIAILRKHIESLKGKNVVENDATPNKAKVVAPGMFKLDLEPLFPKVLKNRDAHVDYIKHTQENADILWELVDSHKTQDSNKPVLPSTGMKSFTSTSRSQPSGNTKKNRILRTTNRNQKNKVKDHPRSVKSSLNKTNRVIEPVCNANVKNSMLNANSELICATCNECMFDAIHDLCVLDFGNDVNVRSKTKSAKSSKKKNIWKPTGKMFTDIGYMWKPTGRTFIIVGNTCPLTSITSTNVKPLKETTSKSVTTPNPKIKIYHRKTKVAKSVDLSSESSILGSRLSKLFSDCKDNGLWVYYVEGLGLNLFFVGQFCDSDLEVAFRKHTCHIRDLEGVDLLKGSRGSNLYTLSLEDMMLSSPICLLSKASKTKSWLWHQRLTHLNFDFIIALAKQGLVRGFPKLKFQKDHLCSACALGKSKKYTHKPKAENSIQEKLHLLHMDLCRPIRIQIRIIRTDNGIEFVNQTLRAYYEDVGISHQTFIARSPQQNIVVEKHNRTLVEAERTMLIFSKAPLFLWAEAVTTACYTQNRSLIRKRHNKTLYELLHSRKPDLSYLHVFGALCYTTNDSEDLGKLKLKADIGIFVGYAPTKKAYRIYYKRICLIIETIHVDFNELTMLASEQFGSGLVLQLLTFGTISS
ncbi:retrovirus-related pol polyprotein from transposon TNT 1-94 [Tanacetum coccineum]